MRSLVSVLFRDLEIFFKIDKKFHCIFYGMQDVKEVKLKPQGTCFTVRPHRSLYKDPILGGF